MLAPNALAIAKSVVYASLFQYPLTLEELQQTLVESTQSVAEILETYRTNAALRLAVDYRDGFFFPAGCARLVDERRRREGQSRAFLDEHRRFLRVLCAIPYARMVALSGSVAHLNLDGAGDLDLFIVTRGPRVWSVTVAVLVIAKLFRRRAITCANFVVADSRLSLEQRDLFTANQAIHLKPLTGRRVFRDFLDANPFVFALYPNFRPSDARSIGVGDFPVLTPVKSAVEWTFSVPSLAVEAFCRYAYGWHLRRRASSWRSPGQVRLERDCLKLHTQSHRESTLDRFESAMRETLARAGRADVPALAAAGATPRGAA
jgi:hypothetical protein